MALRSGFYNSMNNDRKYFASDFSMLFDGIIQDGVFAHVLEKMVVKLTTGMDIAVQPGLAWFNETWTYLDAPYPISLEESDILYDRYDVIALEVHNDNIERTNYIKIIKGTPASEPEKPTLVKEGYYQYPLAYIRVPANSEALEAQNLENVVGTDECPFVVGIQDPISISYLYSQWEAEFDKWFADLQTNLEGDVAANLQNQITQHVTNKNMHIPTLTYSKSGTTHALLGLSGGTGLVSAIFLSTEPFNTGDTFTIDGVPYNIKMSTGETPSDKMFVAGSVNSVVVDTVGKTINFKAGGGYVKGDIIAAENLEPSLGNFSKLDMIPEYAQQYVSPYTQLEIDNQADFTKQCIVTYNINNGSRLIVFKQGSYVDVLTPLGAKVSRLSGFDADNDIIDKSGFGLIMAARNNSTYGYDIIRNRDLGFSAGYSTVLTAKNFIAIIDNSSWATYNAEWCYFSGGSWSTSFGTTYDLGDANAIALSKNCVMFYRSLSSGKMYVFNRTSNKRIKNINAADLAINPANLEADSVHAITFPEETKYFVVRKSGIVDLCTFDPEANTVSVIKSDVGYYGISGNAQLIGSKGFLIDGYKKDSSGTAHGLIEALADGTLLNFWQYGSGYNSETRQYARPTSSGWHCLFLNGEDLFRFPTIRSGALSIGLCGKESYKVLEVVK